MFEVQLRSTVQRSHTSKEILYQRDRDRETCEVPLQSYFENHGAAFRGGDEARRRAARRRGLSPVLHRGLPETTRRRRCPRGGGQGVAYQMSHFWLLNLRTDEAKKKLLEAGRLTVKGRKCLVVDPYRQELRVKLHWVSFGVTNETIHRAFAEYGEVKEVAHERWKVPGFDGVESTTRIVRVVLREGVTLDRLPHQLRLGGGMVLVVVPGRPPLCLQCRMTGHIRRDCRAPRCSECRAFGDERDDCVRSYARAAGRRTNEENADHVMDEEEAEYAAAPAGAPTEDVKQDNAPGTVPVVESASPPKPPATAASATPPEAELQSEISTGSDVAGATSLPVNAEPEMDVEVGSAKRPLEDVGDTTGQELQLRRLERKWKMVSG
ncbi:uncharacterized protein ISCGN_031379 [Ixodes scapularis]